MTVVAVGVYRHTVWVATRPTMPVKYSAECSTCGWQSDLELFRSSADAQAERHRDSHGVTHARIVPR